MNDRLPPRPLLALLPRLVHQYYAQEADATLREAGFGDIRPRHANVFVFVPPEGIQVSLTPRGGDVRPVALASGRRVEERWAQLTGPEELESLRGSLQRLLGKLRDEPEPGADRAAG